MDGISLYLNNTTQAFTQFFTSPVSKITSLGTSTLINLGFQLSAGLFSAYHFFKAYQCKQLTPSQLTVEERNHRLKGIDDGYKLNKAEYLLKKVSESIGQKFSTNIKPDLEQVEALLSSLSKQWDNRIRIYEIKLSLALLYAEIKFAKNEDVNFAKNCRKSDVLINEYRRDYNYNIIDAALKLYEKIPSKSDLIIELLELSFNQHNHNLENILTPTSSQFNSEIKLSDIEFYLRLAKAFNYCKQPISAELLNKFEQLKETKYEKIWDELSVDQKLAFLNWQDDCKINSLEMAVKANHKIDNPIDRFKGFCGIGEHRYSMTHDLEKSFSEANAMLQYEETGIAQTDVRHLTNEKLVLGHLMLARSYVNVNASAELVTQNLESQPVKQFLDEQDSPLSPDVIRILKQLVSQIVSEGKILPEFKTFADRLIERLSKNLEDDNLSVRDCLTIANAFSTLGDQLQANRTADKAFIKLVESAADIDPNDDMFKARDRAKQFFIIFKLTDDTKLKLDILEKLKNLSSLDDEAAILFFAACKTDTQFDQQANDFFPVYKEKLCKSRPEDKVGPKMTIISRLVKQSCAEGSLSDKHKLELLEEALKLLPQSELYSFSSDEIARSYVEVSLNNSNTIMDGCEDTYLRASIQAEAKQHFAFGVATTALVALSCFSPLAAYSFAALGLALRGCYPYHIRKSR